MRLDCRNRLSRQRFETGMKRSAPPKHSKTKMPRGRRGAKAGAEAMNQATTVEFEREELGIAPKE
jgi:hypothetical protein